MADEMGVGDVATVEFGKDGARRHLGRAVAGIGVRAPMARQVEGQRLLRRRRKDVLQMRPDLGAAAEAMQEDERRRIGPRRLAAAFYRM